MTSTHTVTRRVAAGILGIVAVVGLGAAGAASASAADHVPAGGTHAAQGVKAVNNFVYINNNRLKSISVQWNWGDHVHRTDISPGGHISFRLIRDQWSNVTIMNTPGGTPIWAQSIVLRTNNWEANSTVANPQVAVNSSSSFWIDVAQGA